MTDIRPAEVRRGAPALLVAWQSPVSRTYQLLGRVVEQEDGYEFAYLPAATNSDDFRTIPGFSDPDRTYHSKVLFPLLSGRIMSKSRPDRAEWLHRLELKEDATPFEILSHSFGNRAVDTYEFFEEPEVDLVRGTLTFVVPVHGLRYLTDEAQQCVESLGKGAPLRAEAEPDNGHDPRAVGIWAGDHKIGFVPAPVLDYVQMLGKDGRYSAKVVRKNPRSEGTHLRLVMELSWTESDGSPPSS